MKRYCRLLAIMLGGVLLMTSLSACGQKETIPANRTREQYELEKEFQPLFDFLAEEKKDLSKYKNYTSSISLSGNPDKYYHVFLYLQDSKLASTYTIEDGKEKQEIPITLSEGKIEYLATPSIEYDEEIFNLRLTHDYFADLNIAETFKHPETDIQRMEYSVSAEEEFFQHLLEKYNFSSKTNVTLIVGKSSNDYILTIYLVNKERSVAIANTITVMEGEYK